MLPDYDCSNTNSRVPSTLLGSCDGVSFGGVTRPTSYFRPVIFVDNISGPRPCSSRFHFLGQNLLHAPGIVVFL